MANEFDTTRLLVKEVLRSLTNRLSTGNCFDMSYNSAFKGPMAVGAEVDVPFPQRFKVTSGPTFQAQPIKARKTKVTVDQFKGVHFDLGSAEMALSVPRGNGGVKGNYMDRIAEQLAQEIDLTCADYAYNNTNQIVGILGTNPTGPAIAGAVRKKFIQNGSTANGEMDILCSPDFMENVVNGSQTYFNDQPTLGKAFRDGYINRARGIDWTETMSTKSHTAGTWAGAVTVNGAGQTGTSINITCTDGDTFFAGDVICFAGCFNVNPATRRAVGQGTSALKQFRVVNAVTVTGATTATLEIFPRLDPVTTTYTTGQYANCSASPANSAAVTLFPGTASPSGLSGIQSLALAPGAFALVGVELETPKSAEFAYQLRDPETGIALRATKTWDGVESRMLYRVDTLFGLGTLYNDECSIRLLSLD